MEFIAAVAWPRTQVSNEYLLRQELFYSGTPIDTMVRPVLDSSETVKVNFKVELKSVVDVVSLKPVGVLLNLDDNIKRV